MLARDLPVVEIGVVKRVDELLGQVLGRVTSQTGSLAALAPVWRQVVGELAAKHTQPRRLEGRRLVVGCDGKAWVDVLEQERAAVLQKLNAALREPKLEGLVFETP